MKRLPRRKLVVTDEENQQSPFNPVIKIKADNWKRHRFKEIGRGGEAVIYLIRDDTVAKVFLKPNAVEFAGNPELQEAARVRIEEIQDKLLRFPIGLPTSFIIPSGILMKANKVFGYTMPLVVGNSFDRLCRTNSRVSQARKKKIIINLYDLVASLHKAGVVIGDFNENNIIVDEDNPQIIDADSSQFGGYLCRSFMPRFAAPEIIKFNVASKAEEEGAKNKKLTDSFSLLSQHTELTDWYSFLVLVCRLLIFTDPFGGVVDDMPLGERIEKRITFFDKRVVYPCIARPLAEVPRPLLEIFYQVFHLQSRFMPEKEIFESL